MSNFTDTEVAYFKTQRIGRLATVGASGQPHVVPLRFRFNEELDAIDLFGGGMGKSKKFRDAGRTGVAAFVVDDFEQGPRGVEVRGRAETIMQGGDSLGRGADPEFIRLWPEYIVSWGVETEPDSPNGRPVSGK